MLDPQAVELRQEEPRAEAAPLDGAQFPDLSRIFRVQKIEITGDLPLLESECHTPEQFELIKAALDDGFKIRAVTDATRREIEIKAPGEDAAWKPLSEKFVRGVPSEKFPILLREYVSDRNHAIALEIARHISNTEQFAPIVVTHTKNGEQPPAITPSLQEIAEAKKNSPYAILKQAHANGIEIALEETAGAFQIGAGTYSLSIRHREQRLPLGVPFTLNVSSLEERNQGLARAVAHHLEAPPIVIQVTSAENHNSLVIDASQNEALCRAVQKAQIQSLTLTDAAQEKCKTLTIAIGADKPPVSLLLPYTSQEEFIQYLNHALNYSFSTKAASQPPMTMLVGSEEAPSPVFASLEPKLHTLLQELNTLGYAAIDLGKGHFALKNGTTIFEGREGNKSTMHVGEIEKTFECSASITERGRSLRQAIEEFISTDKTIADKEKKPRSSELLTRRNILAVSNDLAKEEKIFKTLQLGVALRLNYSVASEGQNRMGLYYRFADAFSQILIKHRKEGDPTAEEINRVQFAAFDSLTELYISQIPSKEKADQVPEYFKSIYADQQISDDHILIKLGMAATRLALEDRAQTQNRVVIAPQSKVLMLRGSEGMFSPRMFVNQLKPHQIEEITLGTFNQRMKEKAPSLRQGEVFVPPYLFDEKQAKVLLRDLTAPIAGKNSVLYLFSHSTSGSFKMHFGNHITINEAFFVDLVDAALIHQKEAKQSGLNLAHLTIVCDGCSAGAFAVNAHAHIAKAAKLRSITIAKDGMPIIASTTRDRSFNWIHFAITDQKVEAQSSFLRALSTANTSTGGITIGNFLEAADIMRTDLIEKQNRWEYYHVDPDGHPVKRSLHAQIPVISGGTVWSMNEIIERLYEASQRTGHPLPQLPKPSDGKSGLLTLPRQMRLSLNQERKELQEVAS